MPVSIFRRLKVKRLYRINQQITAQEVRVINQEGKQIGILSLPEALKIAQKENKDIVEIAENAKPPVVKIIDFKKFKYLEAKREKEARKHTKETELKEVRFSPFIGEHDLNTALDRVKKFLAEGDLVKITIRFTGRQMAHTEFGPKLLVRIMSELSGLAEKERGEKFEGRRLITILRPAREKKHPEEHHETKNKESSRQAL